jgi:hypothetical protein
MDIEPVTKNSQNLFSNAFVLSLMFLLRIFGFLLFYFFCFKCMCSISLSAFILSHPKRMRNDLEEMASASTFRNHSRRRANDIIRKRKG